MTANAPEQPWERAQLVAWLRRIMPRLESLGPFELLEMGASDDLELIQASYHRIAATRHPDVHRGTLSPEEAEQLMRVFARIAGAYALLRSPEERKRHGARPSKVMAAQTPPTGTPAIPATPPTGVRKISPRALSHVRRAEAMLDHGDYASALLHLRMAVAADPTAKELRQLLADTQARLKKDG